MKETYQKVTHSHFIKTTLAICIAAAIVQTPAAAAQEKSTVVEAESQVEVIAVTGVRGSLTSAMAIKRDASQVVDSIISEDIGEFADANVAEALQRVTGIQIGTGDTGEGTAIAIRGLKQTLTLVNGRTVFTGGSRRVSYEEVPSESLAGVDVYKSPTASQIEGGISGIINMRRLRATSFNELVI